MVSPVILNQIAQGMPDLGAPALKTYNDLRQQAFVNQLAQQRIGVEQQQANTAEGYRQMQESGIKTKMDILRQHQAVQDTSLKSLQAIKMAQNPDGSYDQQKVHDNLASLGIPEDVASQAASNPDKFVQFAIMPILDPTWAENQNKPQPEKAPIKGEYNGKIVWMDQNGNPKLNASGQPIPTGDLSKKEQMDTAAEIDQRKAEMQQYMKDQAEAPKAKALMDNLDMNDSKVVLPTIDRLVKKIQSRGYTVVGPGSHLAWASGTMPADVARDLESLKANLGISQIQEMRQFGGTFGRTTNIEFQGAANAKGSLEGDQSPEQLISNLAQVKDWKLSSQAQRKAAFNDTFLKPPPGFQGNNKSSAPQQSKVVQFNDLQ